MPYVVCLEDSMPAEIAPDFLSKLHYISESVTGFAFEGATLDRVRFDLKPGFTDAQTVSDRIAATARKMCRGYRPAEQKILKSRSLRPGSYVEDPHAELELRGDLFRFGPGRYGLGPRLVELVEVFDNRLRELARAFSASPFQFPSLIGAEALQRCKYLRSFPHSLNFVAHLREDVGAIQHFADNVTWNDNHLRVDGTDLAEIKTMLAPSICFHYYNQLQDRVLLEPSTVTGIGKCFRYESGNLRGLERLWDFTMREVIFVGSKEYVLSEREKSLELTALIFDEWELAYEIRSATDPFFIEEFASQSRFQLAFDLKFEIRADLPYKNDSLAAGSFNFHQDFFGRSFNINDAAGRPVNTGCIGFGLERLALAFVAQHGFDRQDWPASIADLIVER